MTILGTGHRRQTPQGWANFVKPDKPHLGRGGGNSKTFWWSWSWSVKVLGNIQLLGVSVSYHLFSNNAWAHWGICSNTGLLWTIYQAKHILGIEQNIYFLPEHDVLSWLHSFSACSWSVSNQRAFIGKPVTKQAFSFKPIRYDDFRGWSSTSLAMLMKKKKTN